MTPFLTPIGHPVGVGTIFFFLVIGGWLATHTSDLVILLQIQNSDPPFRPTPRGTPRGGASENTNFACLGGQSVGLPSLVSVLLAVSEPIPDVHTYVFTDALQYYNID